MAEIINGLSNLTRQVQAGSGYETKFDSGSNPADKYKSWKKDKSGVVYKQFPPDLPEQRIILVGRDYKAGTGGQTLGVESTVESGYILPVPQTRLIDRYQVNYDTDFSWMNLIPYFDRGSRGQQIARYAGFNLNKNKTVLMEAPMLKRHEFVWKLSPKNASESMTIRDIVNCLKSDMAPPLNGVSNFILHLPYVFDIFFDPNWKQMYGFKPSVIESLDVDYAGGNMHPANYYNGDPESVVISMNIIEIEMWTREDYEKWKTASDPVSTYSNQGKPEVPTANNDPGSRGTFGGGVGNTFPDTGPEVPTP